MARVFYIFFAVLQNFAEFSGSMDVKCVIFCNLSGIMDILRRFCRGFGGFLQFLQKFVWFFFSHCSNLMTFCHDALWNYVIMWCLDFFFNFSHFIIVIEALRFSLCVLMSVKLLQQLWEISWCPNNLAHKCFWAVGTVFMFALFALVVSRKSHGRHVRSFIPKQEMT